MARMPGLVVTGQWQQQDAIRKHTRTGRPAGENSFLRQLELITGRNLRKSKLGRKSIK